MSDYTKGDFAGFWPEGFWPWDLTGRGWNVGALMTQARSVASGHALEIGPGGGFWSRLLAQRFDRLTMVDVVPPKGRVPGLLAARGATTRYIELPEARYDLPGVDDASVDLVWSFDVLCHLSQSATDAYLGHVRRVLRPGGAAMLMFDCWERHPLLRGRVDAAAHAECVSDMGWFCHSDPVADATAAGFGVLSGDFVPTARDRMLVLRRPA